MIHTNFIYLSIYLLLSFNILLLPGKLNLLRTLYIVMLYQCCILCTSERKYILGIGRLVSIIIKH